MMVGMPPNPFYAKTAGSPAQVAEAGLTSAYLQNYQSEMGFTRSVLLSVMLHVGVIALIWIILFALQFFGINLLTFNRLERVKDIEFQLVTTPDEKPRDPKTKNRALHNSRAGGEKIPNVREAEQIKKAGSPSPQPQKQQSTPQKQTRPIPTPQKQVQPTRRPSPQRPTSKTSSPAPKSNQESPRPAPPRPRVTAPKASSSSRRVSVPRPTAPIQVPDTPGPAGDTGPIAKGPIGGGSTSGSVGATGSSAGPTTVPGQFSGGGKPASGGGPSGQGGRGKYSQYGSPGGGGGRAGVDALAEPDWSLYIAQLQQRIRRNWFPPQEEEDKIVVMLFTIARDGRLLSLRLQKSSGSAAADAAARRAVEMSAPFRPLPPEARNNSVNIEFRFDYNTVNSGGGIRRR